MNKQEIDEKIKQAFAEDEAEIFEKYAEEPSLLAQGLELLSNQNRWLNIGSMIVMTAFMALGIYSLWMFSSVQETKSLIGWAMAFGFSMAVIGSLKIYAWMQMEKNNTIREIKRLELQIAMLVERLDDSENKH